MIFDEVDRLKKKKQLSKMDKARFLAQVPDTTISMHITPDPKAVLQFYTSEDIDELFDYWFGIYKAMMNKDGYIWKSEKSKTS